jgi:YesN/AraC family two-component response regulator
LWQLEAEGPGSGKSAPGRWAEIRAWDGARPGAKRLAFAELPGGLLGTAHPDIVFLDINMPEMDGLTAYSEILKIYPDTGCVVISAEKDTTTLRTAMSIGVQEYLIKPFTVEELENAVARVHERVLQTREKLAQESQLRQKQESYLAQLAAEYAKSRRTDDKAIQVFEHLAENPNCEMRWIQNLAMIYIVRQKWGKLKVLAEKIENRIK